MPRRTLVPAAAIASAGLLLTGCVSDAGGEAVVVDTADAPPGDAIALPAASVDDAVTGALAQLSDLIADDLAETGVPGLAVAVVHGGEIVYAEGFGVKTVGEGDPVDPETVFQIASVSKSLSATAVSAAIGQGALTWETPVSDLLPGFALSDPYVTEHATVGDFFSHRTGLDTGAGDDLEDLGYGREYILDHLDMLPLDAFRSSYHYSNYGITVGAEAAAAAVGEPWEDVTESLVYEPLGMTRTSSRYEDFLAEDDRATIHAFVDGTFQPLFDRDPDAQAPAGGVSSNVIDLAAWMNAVLAGGEHGGEQVFDAAALTAATTGEMISGHPPEATWRTSMYGFGFNVDTTVGGRTGIAHSGGFVLGAATNFRLIPSLDLGIVTLTNGGPYGLPEAVNAQFLDLVQYGDLTRDWITDYRAAVASLTAPVGDLVDEQAPSAPDAPRDLADYEGTYDNAYFGPLTVSERDGRLVVAMGADDGYVLELRHWDGDAFAFVPTGENAPEGSLSSATFVQDAGDVTGVTLQFFDTQGLGTWSR